MDMKDSFVLGDVLDLIISQTSAATPSACTETFTISSGCSHDSSHPILNKKKYVNKEALKRFRELSTSEDSVIASGGITEDSNQSKNAIKRRRSNLSLVFDDSISQISGFSYGLIDTPVDSGYWVEEEEDETDATDDEDWEFLTDKNHSRKEFAVLYPGKKTLCINSYPTVEGLSDFEIFDHILDTIDELHDNNITSTM